MRFMTMAGTVLVINVLDPAKHKTAIEDEVVTFDKSTGQARLAHPVVANVVVKTVKAAPPPRRTRTTVLMRRRVCSRTRARLLRPVAA